MTDRDKRLEPASADEAQPVTDTADSALDRAAAAKDLSVHLRQLKHRAEAQNLKMVAYLLNLAEMEALDCAGMASGTRQTTGNRCA